MTAKWIYFQQGDRRNPNQIPCIRQAMDVRNRLHNSAKRQRSDKTEDELKSEGKWLQWEDFLKATRELRKEFLDTRDPGKRSRPTLESARTLHDLLLLTFLSIMPSRSSELRLLETISWGEMMQKPAKMSIKQSVANQKRDFLVKQPNESYWIYLGNWKLFWKKVHILCIFASNFPPKHYSYFSLIHQIGCRCERNCFQRTRRAVGHVLERGLSQAAGGGQSPIHLYEAKWSAIWRHVLLWQLLGQSVAATDWCQDQFQFAAVQSRLLSVC